MTIQGRAPRPIRGWQVWWLASRPKTLGAAIAPVLMGTAMAMADGQAYLPHAVLALLIAVALQIGTNFANDYFDYQHGVDNERRLGPLRVTQAGLVRPETMRRAMVMVFGVAALGGLILAWRVSWWLLLVGGLAILSGVFYTAGPRPLGYLGLGDLFVLIFFGLVAMAGTYYVQAGHLNWPPVVMGLAPGLVSVALLTVNNLRDVETDRLTGKRTLAVRFGARFARWEYVICVVIACLLPPVVAAVLRDHLGTALTVVLLGVAARPIREILQGVQGVSLNRVLAATNQLLIWHALLFSLGWLLS
ncbi:MAG: 1,4-dihydroxy-2-naphthoate polyprenyltransferase [Anaerolineae bacterium]